MMKHPSRTNSDGLLGLRGRDTLSASVLTANTGPVFKPKPEAEAALCIG